MGLNEAMLDMYAGGKVKLTKGRVFGDIDVIAEWIKWLEYIPREQQMKIDEMFYKKLSELSTDEIKYYLEYKEQQRMASLFKVYGVEEMDKEEYKEVYRYMHNDIEELMMSKLTKVELEYAKTQIENYTKGDNEELSRHVKALATNYDLLSMVDSYILHCLSIVDVRRANRKLDEQIEANLEENRRREFMSYLYSRKSV